MEHPEVGTAATVVRTFTQSDFNRFAALSGDDNPIHVDPGYSADSRFGRTAAHGMLLYSVVCGVLAEAFPGAILEEQSLVFPSPTFAGIEMTVWVEVTGVDGDRLEVTVGITDPTGTATCSGESVLRWRAS